MSEIVKSLDPAETGKRQEKLVATAIGAVGLGLAISGGILVVDSVKWHQEALQDRDRTVSNVLPNVDSDTRHVLADMAIKSVESSRNITQQNIAIGSIAMILGVGMMSVPLLNARNKVSS